VGSILSIKQLNIMEIPKKWFVEVTKENKDVLNDWRLSQPDLVPKHDHRFGPGCLIISDGYGDKSYFYLSGKESFLMEGTHEEISYEDFKKYVLKNEVDYTIPGTKLPLITKDTLKRCVDWEDRSEDAPFGGSRRDYISYGSKMFKGHLYILNEKQGYIGSNYFMVKLSDIQRLAKEQNFNQKQEENMKKITYQQAQNIIDVACEAWKKELFTIWGQDIIFKRNIEITETFYQKMRKACTAPQNELFDDIFGKDVISYKVGDWVVGWFCKNDKYSNKAWKIGEVSDKYVYPSTNLTHNTDLKHLRLATDEEIIKAQHIPEGVACLVRDTKTSAWKLAYSGGNGKFKTADPTSYTWEYVQILDVNNLPKY
jgi:hypothetical protein